MKEKIAIVTGASKGIGFEVAKMLSAENYKVYGLSRTPSPCDTVEWVFCDVMRIDSVKQAFQKIIEECGRVDVLICNAGIGISGASEFTPEPDYSRQMDLNLLGSVRCVQQVISVMREQSGGKIVFISSLSAIFPLPFQSFYSASKAALNAFSDALGIELKPFGIETGVVMLNDVKTEFTDNRGKIQAGDDIYQGRIHSSVEKMEKSERTGMTPEQVAQAVRKILNRRHLPSHKIVGLSNEFLGFLYRVLPTNLMLKLLAKIYG